MIKIFYKHRDKEKFFFNKKVKIRTVAYGKEINERFCKWLNLFSRFRLKEKDFLSFAQQNLFCAQAAADVPFFKGPEYTLKLKNNTYSINESNHLCVNGEKRLFLGDVKAFVLFFCEEIGGDKLVALINYGDEGTKLTVFDITDSEIVPSKIKPLRIESSLSSTAYMICAERHVFIIRDFVLHYYYINIESGEIEPVAIFEDKPFKDSECCKSVIPFLIFDDSGRIFWVSGGHLYSIRIGFPKNVTEIDNYGKGKVVSMKYGDKVLNVKIDDGDLSQKAYRYVFNGKRYEKQI